MVSFFMFRTILLLAASVLFVYGCARPVDKKQAAELASVPQSVRNASILESLEGGEIPDSGDPLKNISYMFGDPDLERVMARALENSPDVLILASKIRQARSEAIIAGANLFPTVSVGADYSYSDGNYQKTMGSAQNNLNISASFSWEIDLFGRANSARKALKEQFHAAEKDLLAGRVSLLGDVASYYFSIRSAAGRIKVYKEIADNYEALVEVYRQKLEFGLVEASDLMGAENDFFSAYNSVKNLETELEKSRNALLVLIGGGELGFDPDSEYVMPVPKLPDMESVPAEALLNRPDVMASVDALNAQIYQTAGRKAALYPTLTINGSIGQIIASSSGVGDLIWQIAGSLSAPLLNRKELYENLRIQQEAEKQAQYTLRKTVSTALGEIEDSVFQAGASGNILENSRILYKNTSETMNLVAGKYENGLTDIVELLKSRNEALNAKASLATSELNDITSSINLYKAFGGGFGRPLKMVENGTDY